jgi:2-polyprenyl-3-methyl-5-hydroxy-6-metoxy-1,4-benzoquinol methylase
LSYRYPNENAVELEKFYDESYSQPGLTTDLPDDKQLDQLRQTRFANTQKDYLRFVKLIQSLGFEKDARILDYGANWGYGVWQLQQAGYTDTTGYELSRRRAAFGGKKLDVEIASSLGNITGQYDVIMSSHVLEHVPDPATSIRDQLSLLKPGGVVIAMTPNGSEDFQTVSPDEFKKYWGQVHPVLLTDQFVEYIGGGYASYITSQTYLTSLSETQLDSLRNWNKQGHRKGDMSHNELLLIIASNLNQS